MNIVLWILAVLCGIVCVMLLVGGIVFWRGWMYAVRHKDEMVVRRLELDEMLAKNRAMIDNVRRMEREMDNREKADGDGERKEND